MNDNLEAVETQLDANERIGDLTEMLREVRDNGLIYWEPNTSRGAERRADMIARIDKMIGDQPAKTPKYDLTTRERDVVLAALRLWQEQRVIPDRLLEIAMDSGDRPLSPSEIDTLIEEKLNA